MEAYASEACQNKSYRQLEIGGSNLHIPAVVIQIQANEFEHEKTICDPSKWQFNYIVLHTNGDVFQ